MRWLGLALAAFDVWLIGLLVDVGPWINVFAAVGVASLVWLLWSNRGR